MTTTDRRRLLSVMAAAAPVVAGCTPRPETPPDPLALDDASGLNLTRVARHETIRASSAELESRARGLILDAARANQPVCIGGARHSMGGQSLPPDGGVASGSAAPECIVDPAARTYTVSAGARWRQVIRQLDPLGLSPTVTQSNNDFTIGGAMSVNAHGWAVPFGPVGSTVRRFRLMLADGLIRTCSPDESPDLFAACIGGYGLFGLLLDVELTFTDNLMLDRTQDALPASAFSDHFVKAVHTSDVRMAYGRLSLSKGRFLKDAILVEHRPRAEQPSPLPSARAAGSAGGLTRRLFRAQQGSDAGKSLRWWAETQLSSAISGPATRNSLMNVPVKSFAGSDTRRTDILHEYFVPPAALETFLADCRRLIPASDQDLLNLTLRWVEADTRSLLSFAPGPRIALVMLFSQEKTAAAEADMQALTQRLIDAALAAGGGFYLPYRLHARPNQLRRAYPKLEAFVELKRRIDPGLRFRNQMWDAWLANI